MHEKIIVAINNEKVAERISKTLISEGYDIIASIKSGNELIRMIRNYEVNLVISGYKLKDMTLIDVYNIAGELTKFLAIVNEPYKSFIQEESDVFYLSSPINNIILLNTIDIIMQSERMVSRYKEKVEYLERKIEDRIIIEKAKGKLMKERMLREDEAFRYIQKQAMNRRMVLREVAEEILLS